MNRFSLFHIVSAVLLGGAIVLQVGCGSARRGVPVQPPVQLTDAQAEQGRRVYMRFCNGCHPGGEAGLGLGINNKPLPGFAIRFQVRHGLGVMPSFSEEVISDEQLDALSKYLVALRDHDPE